MHLVDNSLDLTVLQQDKSQSFLQKQMLIWGREIAGQFVKDFQLAMVKSFQIRTSLLFPALCYSSALGTVKRCVKWGVLDLKGLGGGEGTTLSHQ